MTKQLYEEALADVRKLTEVAEDNAKRAIIDAVTPRIKQLIENELLNEDNEEMLFDDEVPPHAAGVDTPVSVAVSPDSGSADAISMPDAEGKVTLDLDALSACEPGVPVDPPMFGETVPAENEYVLGLESLKALTPMIDTVDKFNSAFKNLSESVRQLSAVSPSLRSTTGYNKQITRTISRVENMYDYVQERITNPARKKVLEERLENFFKELTKLQELKMSKKLKDLIKEDDAQLDLGGGEAEDAESPGELTLKLSGLPDDVDLDNIGVDLVASSEDEESDGDSVELDDGAEEGGDEGGDGADLGDFDLGGDDNGEEPGDQMEALNLSDDTIVEIDEGMLRREIARMKRLREQSDNAVPSNAGNGVDADAMDDFGGGADDGDPFLDGEVTTESEEMDESDDALDELQNRAKADGNKVSANSDMQSVAYEGLRRRVAAESRIQERTKARAKAIQNEVASARGVKKIELKREYAQLVERFNMSVGRAKKLQERIAESAKRSKPRLNSESPARGVKAESSLRKQLAEQNLLNIKLVYANKLLQNESLTKRQKANVIQKLDDAKTVREAKLVYESLTNMFVGNKPLKEGREQRVLGSSSRLTRPGSTPQTLNEGFETDRWATLAGITKRS